MWVIMLFLIILLIAVAFFGVKFYNRSKQASKPISIYDDLKAIEISDIDKMQDGSEFEMYLYRLLIELGYSGVYKTVGSRDFGADVVFTDREGYRNVVQAKRYSVESPVGISAVQEVYSCMRYYKAKRAIVIATAKFTESCETLAGVNHVRLIDRTELISIIEAFQQDDYVKVRNIIELEPRMILESWTEVHDSFPEVKKDRKAEKFLKSFSMK
jgi:restriction system protein